MLNLAFLSKNFEKAVAPLLSAFLKTNNVFETLIAFALVKVVNYILNGIKSRLCSCPCAPRP